MRFLNYGSLNIDTVYSVPHIVAPGETISSTKQVLYCGGKGLNQSIALARAGAQVYHAGMVGADGAMLTEALAQDGVDTANIKQVDTHTGSAFIQVADNGQNSIILSPGANAQNTPAQIDAVLANFSAGDMVLLQNEINLNHLIIAKAYEKGLSVVVNPSPYDEALAPCDFAKIRYLIVNEVEGEQITGETAPKGILAVLRQRYPGLGVVLTLGKRGAVYDDGTTLYSHGTYDVPVVDTTAAGDTFTGYFFALLAEGAPPATALEMASIASSIAVSQQGACPSIPLRAEVEEKRGVWVPVDNG